MEIGDAVDPKETAIILDISDIMVVGYFGNEKKFMTDEDLIWPEDGGEHHLTLEDIQKQLAGYSCLNVWADMALSGEIYQWEEKENKWILYGKTIGFE